MEITVKNNLDQSNLQNNVMGFDETGICTLPEQLLNEIHFGQYLSGITSPLCEVQIKLQD
jgi:hypothetical protein